MEKNAAYSGLSMFLRKFPLADAWRAMHAPAPAASRMYTTTWVMGWIVRPDGTAGGDVKPG